MRSAMKVCLVSPPGLTDQTVISRHLSEHAPLGVLTLAAVLEQGGVSAHIVDLNYLYHLDVLNSQSLPSTTGVGQIPDFYEVAAKRLAGQPFDVFGFSTVCGTFPMTIRLAEWVKCVHPEAKVILGGPQASVVDVATLEAFPFIDLIVRGEAEETIVPVLEALSDRRRLREIQGVTFRSGGQVVRNPNAEAIQDLDGLPLPAFHLYPDLDPTASVPLELGRGCPFACTFCSTNDFFRRRFRLKSPAAVIEQMRALRQRYGCSSFALVHDMFTVDRKRVVEFCEAMIASGEGFSWGCSARTDCIDEELIDLMARAGCGSIFFGIETVSVRMQKVIDKGLDLGEAARHIRSTTSRGMRTTVSHIIGFPTETKEDLAATVASFADALRFECAVPQVYVLAPLAETPIHSEYRTRLRFDGRISQGSRRGWQQDAA